MDAQTSLFDGNSRPDVIKKFLLWDDFAGTLRQIYKNVERPAAEGKLQALAPNHPFPARKLERAELQASIDTMVGHGCQRLQVMLPAPFGYFGNRSGLPTERRWPAEVRHRTEKASPEVSAPSSHHS